MTFTTVELNTGLGGAKPLFDTALGTIDGEAPPTGAVSEVVEVAGRNASFSPAYGGPDEAGISRINIDPDGHLITRGTVHTDEGTFRVNFSNTSLAVSIGAVTVAGAVVTGTGFLAADVKKNDYFKVAADADTAYVQVGSIDSDTSITLVSTYSGSASGTGNRAIMRPVVGAGGSIAVASGQCTITAGTTAGAVTGLVRLLDYAPLVFRVRTPVSQRIVNQALLVGLREDAATPRWFSRVRFDGTTNTTAICETGRNPTGAPSASETESTTFTIPDGLTSAAVLDVRIEQMTETVRFYVGGVRVAEHSKVIPQQFDEMAAVVEFVNAGSAPATSTTATLDYVTGKNHNKVEAGIFSETEQLIAANALIATRSYSVAGVIAVNTDLMVIDCRQARTVSLQAVAIGTTGRLDFFLTNDLAQIGTAQPAYPVGGGAAVTTTTAAGMWLIPTGGAAFLRVRLGVATTAGTTTLAASVSQTAHPLPAPTTQPISGTVTASATAGTAAQGATASGNPVFTGGVAKTAQPTARTDGQMVAPLLSKVGHAIGMVGQIRDLNDTTAPITLTATTETTLIAAVAAVFNDIYSLTLINTSATGVRVDLRSVTAGAVVESFWLPPTATLLVNPAVPYKQATVNTAWTVQLSAAVTDVRVSARSVRNV